jgi:hypothetical protein
MVDFGGSYSIPKPIMSGVKSLKVTASTSPFSITSTQTFGDLSAYTTVASGQPTSGTVGLWIFCAAGEVTSATLRIGSSASDYAEVAGVMPYPGTYSTVDGWNYVVFRLKNSTVTGTPSWAAVDYAKITFTSGTTPVLNVDYFTIGYGDVIGLNGLGDGHTIYSTETETF